MLPNYLALIVSNAIKTNIDIDIGYKENIKVMINPEEMEIVRAFGAIIIISGLR
jgi:hypothetical protein